MGKMLPNIKQCRKNIEKAGAELIILCTNTMHKISDLLLKDVNIPFLHIADMTADEIIKGEINIVGLLRTKYTMSEYFYKSKLIENGIRVIIPEENEQNIINEIIYNELCKGIILGCTEIGLLIFIDKKARGIRTRTDTTE